MAEESDLERTEQPSERRLEQAREQGQVPRSRELGSLAVLLTGGTVLWFGAGLVRDRFAGLMQRGLTIDRADAFTPALLGERLAGQSLEAAMLLLPFFAALVVAAIAAPVALSGWNVSLKAIAPDFARLSPLRGLSNLVSLHGVAELLKAMAKAAVIGLAVWFVIGRYGESMLGLVNIPLGAALQEGGRIAGVSFLILSAALVLVVGADVPFQIWQHHRQLRMTRDELKQESRELLGDPQVKAAVKSKQREMARRRMMAAVPKADVIVTNPTHYAVALAYASGAMNAPRVVAKGRGAVAVRIRELGSEHGVPLLEAPPLARALFRHVELDAEIPERLYTAVAEVLAYVFQLRRAREGAAVMPPVPAALAVPADLDPGPDAA
jgi:flagellar biosynthetic protein FlhB